MDFRWIIFIIFVNFAYANAISCHIRDTINVTSGTINDNGQLLHNGLIYNKEQFAEFSIIYKSFKEIEKVKPHLRGCVCELKKCIRICRFCEENESTNQCVSSNKLIMPNNDEISLETSNEFAIVEGKPCKVMTIMDPKEYDEDLWSFNNGSVYFEYDSSTVDYREYCFVQNKTDVKGVYETILHYCHHEGNVVKAFYPIGMIVSLPFLLVTFFIYGCIPELRNLHGKCLMCYIIGLLTFYIGIILVNLNKGNYVELFECKLIGYLILIGVQLCFFWLNVMCYDIWSAFKVGMKTHGSDRKRFLGYCLYAFGVPLMIISLIFLIDSTEFIPKDYRPEIGIFRCYIKSSKLVESIYVYIPISTILIVNIVLYSITALTIYRVKKETAVIRSGDNQRHAKVESDKDKFMLYLRLFIVMGASWIMESISVLFDQVEYIFYATDFLNCIQGVIIFILFVWTPKVKKILIKKYRSARNLPPLISSSQRYSSNSVSRKTDETTRISSIRNSRNFSTKKIKQEQPILSHEV